MTSREVFLAASDSAILRRILPLAKAIAILTLLAASLGILIGCSPRRGQEAAAPAASDLQEVSDMLHAAGGAAGRSPANLAEVDQQRRMFPRGYEAVKSGSVVVLWGTPLQDEGEVGKNEVVLAYEKDVPTNGGYVLLSAGTVKKMSASEFGSAPKAATK
jgi:hypothetical protein